MWVNEKVWKRLNDEVDRLFDELRHADEREERLRVQAQTMRLENNGLRERLIAAEGDKRFAQGLADSITVQMNKVQHERDQLFAKIFDPTHPVQVVTPKIGAMPSVMPNVDLFGDPNELKDDLTPEDEALERQHAVEPLTELSGRVYDPAAELGGMTDLGYEPPPPRSGV